MVDGVKMSLGLNKAERKQRQLNRTLTSNVPEVVVATPKPVVPELKIGYLPQAPTGIVPQSSSEIADANYIAPVKATPLEAFGAGFGRVGIEYAGAIRDNIIYDIDPTFDSRELSNEFFALEGAGTPTEVKQLASAKSFPHWKSMKERIIDTRMRDRAISDSSIAGTIGSFIDADIALTAIPIVGVGAKASTAARVANRVGAGVVTGAAVAGVQSTLGNSLGRTDAEKNIDIGIASVARMLAPLAGADELAAGIITPIRSATETAQRSAPQVAPVARRSATDTQAAKDVDIAVANTVGLSDEAIAARPTYVRGELRKDRAVERRAAVAEVEAKYAAEAAAADAIEAEARLAAQEATNVPKIAQEALDELQELYTNPPTGTPANRVAKNKTIAALQSTWDYLNYITRGDNSTQVNKLLSNPAINNGDDAVSAINVYNNNFGTRLGIIEDALKDAVASTGVKSNPFTRVNGSYGRATKEVSADFQEALQKVDADVLEYHAKFGKLPDTAGYTRMILARTDKPHIQTLIQKYIDSDIAMQVHKNLSGKRIIVKEVVDDAGNVKIVDGMEDIVRRPTYMNLRHNFNVMSDTVRAGKASWDEIADFIGAQIVKQYPDLLKPKNASKSFVLTERQVGQHFLQTQDDLANGLSSISATGMNKEQIANILTKTGNFAEKDARIAASEIFSQMHNKGTSTPKNLRRRIGWDWNQSLRTESGYDLSMRDLVDSNVLGNVEDYTRSMAHKLGLADYGIRSEADLDNLLETYMKNLPKDIDPTTAKQFMKDTKNTLLGRPIDSNPVPQAIRSAQATADLFLLANSGLYTFVDIATQMQKVGLLKSLPYFKRGMGTMFKDLKGFSPTEAKSLEDILTGRMLADSRFRNFSVRYADNFEVGGGIHEAAQYYGQTARFMNLSESLKRFQVGVLAGVYVSNLKGAMKGSTKELAFMKDKLKISDDLIQKMQGEYAKHGTNIDDWSNMVRVKYEQAVFHDADNLAMKVNTGEVPAILEYSAVGRIIFPYMRYAFGMQNKVLRRTIERDGHVGLAKLMAVQIPTAMLVAAAINVRQGKDPMDNIHRVTLRSMTALGALNYPMELAMGGIENGGVTATVPFAKTYKFGEELLTNGGGEGINPNQLIKNSPAYANVVVDYLMLAVEKE